MIREINGIADAKKVMMVGETDDIEIRVVDGLNQRVILKVPASPASLTCEQARYLAMCLERSADRLEGRG